MTQTQDTDAHRVLITFAGEHGRRYKDELLPHIEAFGLQALHDERLPAGEWEPRLREWLATCDAALAIVDMYCLQPGFCRSEEVPKLLSRQATHEIAFVPILLRDVGGALDAVTFPVTLENSQIEQRTLKSIVWAPTRPIHGQKGFGAPPLLEDPHDTNRRERYYCDAMALLLDFLRTRGKRGSVNGNPHDDGDVDPASIEEAFLRASQDLLSYESMINGQWIERPELQPLLTELEQAETTTMGLLGAPGSGKSAALARLGQHYAGREGWSVLAIKVDRLEASVASPAALAAELGLERSADVLVRALARAGRRCLVLVDQLDVLVDLAGAHPRRLAVVLDFIEAVAGRERVHLLLSCREAEFESNIQLKQLNLAKVVLGPLPSAQVGELLRTQTTLCLPESVLSVLQTPNVLRLVVEHADQLMGRLNAESDVLDVVVDAVATPEAISTAMQVAARMGEHEQLWLLDSDLGGDASVDPSSHRQLAESKLAVYAEGRFEFIHQVVFEYFWARHVEAEGFDTLLGGPQTTYVRARLRNALRRLQTHDSARFVVRLRELWASESLRTHLRFLLLDLVGEIQNPTDAEAQWLRERLKDLSWRHLALQRIASVAWFDALEAQLQCVLGTWGGDGQAAARLLHAAAAERSERVVALLDRHWLQPERIRSAQWVAERLDLLVPESVRLWREIAASQQCDRHMLIGYLDRSTVAPELAADLLGLLVRSKINQAIEEPTSDARTRALMDVLAEDWDANVSGRIRDAPRIFLERVWDPLQRAIDATHSSPARWGGYPYSHACSDDFRLGRALAQTVDLVAIALESFAQRAPAEFERFVSTQVPARSNAIHRLICAALVNAPTDIIHSYLSVEPQRLMVERGRAPYATRALLVAIGDQLANAEFEQLVHRITELTTQVGPTKPGRKEAVREAAEYFDNALRVGLLSALPRGRLSESVGTWFDRVAAGLELRWDLDKPRSKRVARAVRTQLIGLPQMAPTQIRERVAQIFEQERVWDSDSETFSPGPSDLARELAELLVEVPDKAAAIFAELEPGQLEQVIGATLQAWSAQGQAEQVLSWVHDPALQESKSSAYRGAAARALRQVAGSGLSPRTCELLEAWLADWSLPDEPSYREDNEYDVRVEHSMLDRSGPSWGISDCGSCLTALLAGLLNREQPAVDEALAALARHDWILRDAHELVAFQMEGLPLFQHRWQEAYAISLSVVEADPRLMLSVASMQAIFRYWPDDPTLVSRLRALLEPLRRSSWAGAAQAHAELTTVMALVYEEEWARDAVEVLLGEIHSGDMAVVEPILAGVVHVAANAICYDKPEGEKLARCLRWLTTLAPLVPDKLAEAWLLPLSRGRNAKPERVLELLPLMQAAATNGRLLARSHDGVLYAARAVVSESPAHAYGVLNSYVKAHKVLHLRHDTPITDVIGALQRTPGYRFAALGLLEQLMLRDVWGVHLLIGRLEMDEST